METIDKFEKVVINDTKGILIDIAKSMYSLEQLSEVEIVEIANKTNKKLGYELFTNMNSTNLSKEFALITRMIQINSVKDIDITEDSNLSLKEKAEKQLYQGVKLQDYLYDEIVLPSYLESSDDAISKAYKTYIEKLNGFDIKSFRKCVNELSENIKVENPEKFVHFKDMFVSIAEYITYRNAFDKKRKEIFDMNGTNDDKQAIFDKLDRNRSKAHNGMIKLFNELNEFADELGISRPYLNDKHPFNPNNPEDRERAAKVLYRQETLFEIISKI